MSRRTLSHLSYFVLPMCLTLGCGGPPGLPPRMHLGRTTADPRCTPDLVCAYADCTWQGTRWFCQPQGDQPLQGIYESRTTGAPDPYNVAHEISWATPLPDSAEWVRVGSQFLILRAVWK